MSSTDANQPTNFSQFSIFPVADAAPTDAVQRLATQLPFIDTLCEKFEAATGWEVDFQAERSQEATVKGQLEITDMSADVPAGKPAAHRQKCDQLVGVIDQMISIIQDDHDLLEQGTTGLCKVIDVPFDWWSLKGSTGFRRGDVVGWGITEQQKIRLYTARTDGECAVSNTIASVSVLANLELCTDNGVSLNDTKKLATRATKKFLGDRVAVESVSCVEIDPITGSYQVDGLNPRQGMLLVDVHSRTVVDLPETVGTLVAGEVLIVGHRVAEKLEQVSALLQRQEMTSNGLAERIKDLFENEPNLVILRK